MFKPKKKYSLALLFIVVSIVWYIQAFQYGFVSDFLGWVYKYQNGSFSDIANCFGYNGNHQFFHLVNYSFYKLAGNQFLLWSILFAGLHGVNAYLLFQLILKLKDRWHLDLKHIEWFVSFLFLIAPFQIETLSWNACLHYLISLFFLLLILIKTLSFLENQKPFDLVILTGAFLLSLFTLEINFSTPFICLAVLFFDNMLISNRPVIDRNWYKVLGPLFSLLILYFVLNKLILGDWIGHYGTEVHLSMPFHQIIANGFSYILHHAVYLDLFEYNTQKIFYDFISKPIVSYSLLLISIAGLTFAILKFNKLDPKLKLAGVFLVVFFMALVPILSLYFYYVTPFKNDRYLYFASPFLFISVCTLAYYLNYTWRYSILILYVLFAAIFSRANLKSTALAAQGAEYMLLNFPCEKYQDKEIVLLGLADNFRGCYLYSDYADDANSFKKAMEIRYPERTCHTNLLNPAQFNMKFSSDGLGAHFVDEKTIKVFIQQWGTWFWRHGKGLGSYETPRYRVETHGWYYLLHLKEDFENAVFLLPEGAEWKELKRAG